MQRNTYYVCRCRLNGGKIPFFFFQKDHIRRLVDVGSECVSVRISDFKCCLCPSTSQFYFSALAVCCFVSVVTAKDSSREGGRSDHRR